MRLSYEVAPKIGNTLVAADGRRRRALLPAPRRRRACWRCARRGFKSWGDAPDFMYFGGNSEMRGYEYLQFVGDQAAFFNAELRFPFIEAMLTPVGVLGGIRGVFFANMGGGHFEGQPFKWFSRQVRDLHADHRLPPDSTSRQQEPIYGTPTTVTACGWWTRARRTASASRPSPSASRSTSTSRGRRCSTRTGRTCAVRGASAAARAFRKPKFSVWIGYDF